MGFLLSSVLFLFVSTFLAGSSEAADCAPIDPQLTATKTGQISWDKCIEYQERYVYPCEGSIRGNNCKNRGEQLIRLGDAAKGEFPHMALLGYGEDVQATNKWYCGGSIVSDRFILTAGHCAISREDGPMSTAKVGSLKRTEADVDSVIYKIKRVIVHPDYKPPSKYNDIALAETEKVIQFNEWIRPACLDTTGVLSEKAIITGWGKAKLSSDISENLQKLTLSKYSDDVCNSTYGTHRFLRNGIDLNSQACYGDEIESVCQGYGGSPVQVKSAINCMHSIIAVTSFGKCVPDRPDVYTRVSRYLPWIESIVWA